MTLRRPAVLICAFLILLTGCTQPEQDVLPVPAVSYAPEEVGDQLAGEAAEETPSPEITPARGGTLRASSRIPKTFNPLINGDESVDAVLKLLFEPLVAMDESFRPVPNITDFFVSEDGMSIVLEIKPNMLWSDGERVKAADIIYSLNVIKDAPANAVYKKNIANYAGWAIIDSFTVVIDLKQPDGGVAGTLCFPAIPEHHFRRYGAMTKPLGNGLYRMETQTQRSGFACVRNENHYWSRPYIARIEVVYIPDRQTELYAFDQRLIDVFAAEAADWGAYNSGNGTRTDEYATMQYEFIGFNFNNAAIRERAVREAIAHALDFDRITYDFYLEYADRAETPVHPDSWLFDPEAAVYGYDPEAAAEKLSSSGYALPLYFGLLVNNDNPERLKVADAVVASLSEIGIEIYAERLPYEEYVRRIEAGEYDMFIGGFTLPEIPELSFAFGSQGAGNVFNYADEVTDAMLLRVAGAVGDEAYAEAAGDLQKRIASELPCIGLVFKKSALLTSRRVYGDKRPRSGNIFYNVQEWFIHED